MARRKRTDSSEQPLDSGESSGEQVRLWEDFVDILYAPSAVFARRRSGKFGSVLLFLTLTGVALHFLTRNAIQPILDAEFALRSAEMIRENPELTSEDMAAGRDFFENFAPVIFAVMFPFAAILTGIVLWIVGKLFDAKEPLRAALMVATYSQVPRLFQYLTTAAQGLFLPPERITSMHSVSFSLARFMDPVNANSVLLAMASLVDVYTIWVTVLLGIGLHVVGGISRRSAAIAAGITWLLGGLPAFLDAIRAG